MCAKHQRPTNGLGRAVSPAKHELSPPFSAAGYSPVFRKLVNTFFRFIGCQSYASLAEVVFERAAFSIDMRHKVA